MCSVGPPKTLLTPAALSYRGQTIVFRRLPAIAEWNASAQYIHTFSSLVWRVAAADSLCIMGAGNLIR